MELLDRYLQAVKKHLPLRRQDDIIAELRANMESQLEDKETELGRPLTTSEAEDWLRKQGPPMMVAARYQPQQYLIGPSIFPVYWFVLRTAFFWAVVIYSIVAAVLIAFGPSGQDAVITAALRVPGILVYVAVWITLVFAALEFTMAHFPGKVPPLDGLTEKWSPSTLPPLEKNPLISGKRRSYGQAIAEVIFGFIAIVWLLLIPQHPFLLLGPGVVFLQATPFALAHVWVAAYWLIIALNVIQLIWRCVDLARGSWQRASSTLHIVSKAFGLVPLILLVNAHDYVYVTLKNPAVDQLRYGATVDSVNRGIHSGLSIICAIVVLQLIWDVAQIALATYRARQVQG
jgi:hypothetical protein